MFIYKKDLIYRDELVSNGDIFGDLHAVFIVFIKSSACTTAPLVGSYKLFQQR
jgi:hypothetical protein